jgi:hypothetical protein
MILELIRPNHNSISQMLVNIIGISFCSSLAAWANFLIAYNSYMFDLLQFVLLYRQICTRPVSTLWVQISTWVQMVIWRSHLMRHETQRHATCYLSFSRRQGKTRRAAYLHTTPDAASLLGINFWIRKKACDWKEQPSPSRVVTGV